MAKKRTVEKADFVNVARQLGLSEAVLQDEDFETMSQRIQSEEETNRSQSSDSSKFALSLPTSMDESSSQSSASEKSPLLNTRNSTSIFDFHLQNSAKMSHGMSAGDAMKKFYQIQVEKLRSQLSIALQNKAVCQNHLENERKNFVLEKKSIEAKYNAEIKQLREVKAMCERKMANLERKLKVEKDQFLQLKISNALWDQLHNKSPDELSLKEYIQLRIHSFVKRSEDDLERTRQEWDTFRKSTEIQTQTKDLQLSEINSQFLQIKEQEKKLRSELELSEISRNECEDQLHQLRKTFEEVNSNHSINAMDLDTLVLDKQKLLDKIQDLEREKIGLSSKLAQSGSYQNDLNELTRKIELLETDKKYLMEDREQLKETNDMMRQQKNKLEEKIELHISKEKKLEQQMNQIKEETKNDWSEKYEKQIMQLQAVSKKEIEEVKATNQQIYEKENQLLRDARSEAMIQTKNVQLKLDKLTQLYEKKVLEDTQAEAKNIAKLSTLRNDIKMKTFEIHQLGISLEQKVLESNQVKLQLECEQTKINLHKSEFAKLESSSSLRISELERLLDAEVEKVRALEQFDSDLNGVVYSQLNSSQDVESNKLGEATKRSLPSLFNSKRKNIAIFAKKLMEFEDKIDQLQGTLHETQTKLNEAEKEKLSLQNEIENQKQPQEYLIQQIKKKDIVINNLKEINEGILSENKELRDNAHNMEKEIGKVILQRQEIEWFKKEIEQLNSLQKNIKIANKPNSNEISPIDGYNTDGKTTKAYPKWYTKIRQ